MVWTGTRAIVWGGDNNTGTLFSDGFLFDPIANAWAPITNAGAPSPRTYPGGVAWTGSQLIVWGGHDGLPVPYLANTGGVYTPP